MDSNTENKWKCSHCSLTFKHKSNFDHHLATHDPTATVKCKICGKIFKNPASLSSHMARIHTDRDRIRPACNICNDTFSTPTNLQRHIDTVHSNSERPRFPCEFPGCEKSYLDKAHLSTHVRSEHDKNPARFPCSLCGKEFKIRSILAKHISTHTAEKPFKCATCGWSFAQKGNLNSHQMTHMKKSSRKMFKCHLCLQKFPNWGNLKRHLDAVHNPEERPRLQCEFPGCDKSYLNKGEVSRHVRNEHVANAVRFPCSLCGKKFKSKTELEAHITTHTTEKAHSCSTCGRRFARRNNMKLHERTHIQKSSRETVKCHLCQQTFLNRVNLRTHIRIIHENRRNYRCTFCDKSSASATDLKRHVEAKHQEANKIYTCDKCEYKSHSKYNVGQHSRRHHIVKRHECYFCKKQFSSFYELARHCSLVHTLER